MSEHTINMEESSTQETIVTALQNVNLLFQSAHANIPVGLVPEAAKAQQAGLQQAGQQVVNVLEKLLPKRDEPVLLEPEKTDG